jgi:hypothetical protein
MYATQFLVKTKHGRSSELLELSLNKLLFYVLLFLGDPAGTRLREYGYGGQAHLSPSGNGSDWEKCVSA